MICGQKVLLGAYFAVTLTALIWSVLQLVSGQTAALAALSLWLAVLMLLQNRLPRPPLDWVTPYERPLRALALGAFGLGLLLADRGPLLWWCLGGLGVLLSLLRWQWKRQV